MTAAHLPVALEPALVEAAVLWAIAGRAEEGEFRRGRDRLYELADGEARETAFWDWHGAWFARLALGQPIQVALAELPLLAQHCRRGIVSAAPTRREEGADLLVDGEVRTVLIRLRCTSFLDPAALLGLLRAELLHVADMVDSAFGYQPTLPEVDGGPAAAHLLRERYRALWSASVAGRLARRGVADESLLRGAQRGFAAAFPMLGDAVAPAFEHFFTATGLTHAELLAFAAAPGGAQGVEQLVPGGRCPLCGFVTHAVEPAPEALPAPLAARIAADAPGWRPCHGLCRQCADLYRARPLSLAAAAELPGMGRPAARAGVVPGARRPAHDVQPPGGGCR